MSTYLIVMASSTSSNMRLSKDLGPARFTRESGFSAFALGVRKIQHA